MTSPITYSRTAIVSVAVLLLTLLTVGCVTKRDITEVKQQLDRIESQNQKTQRLVARMDSIIAASADADDAMRGEMRYSMSELSAQIAQLLANYNELVDRIDQLAKQRVIKLPPTSSPGAQQPAQTETTPPPSVAASGRTCDSTYDVSFLLVRQGEYQKAIDGFAKFMADCPKHVKVENAIFWTGECYYSMEKYPQAIEQFEKLLKDFPSSVNTPGALYKLGRSYQEMGNVKEAKEVFKRLVDEYPDVLEG
ncbi:MAG: tol-pal system protein YbgF, partial [Candidatus Zixiibacteriota bacterium]